MKAASSPDEERIQTGDLLAVLLVSKLMNLT